MALHLVTGYAGEEHVTSADQGSFNAGVVGNGQFVLDRGQRLRAEIVSNNIVRIYDGDILMQGRHIRLSTNAFEEIAIENGSQLMKRHDLIVARYEKDLITSQESARLMVIKGAPSGSPVDPIYEQGNIFAGEPANGMPLYRVRLDGLTIVGIEPMFTTITAFAPSGPTPGKVTNVVVSPSSSVAAGPGVVIDWENPTSDQWAKTVLVRRSSFMTGNTFPKTPTDGTVIIENYTRNVGIGVGDVGLVPGVEYYYSLFTLNRSGHWSEDEVVTFTHQAGGRKRAWAGSVSVTPSAANVPTPVEVSFSSANFSAPPIVCATAQTTVIGTSVLGVGVSGVTATGCTVYVTRTNTSPTTVHVIAREAGAS